MTTTLADLKTYARRRYLDKSDAQATAVLLSAINAAIKMIAQRDHPYFIEQGYLNLKAPYTTGTVAISQNGTQATLATGTWPADAVGQFLKVESEPRTHLEIGVRDSDSLVTFANAAQWVYAAVTADDYVLYRDKHALPDNFRCVGKLIDKFMLSDIEWLPDESEWFHKKMQNFGLEGRPLYGCIGEEAVMLWPYDTDPQVIPFLYMRWPTTLANDGDEMDFLENLLTLVHRAIDLQLAIARGREIEGWRKEFLWEEERARSATTSPSGNIMQLGAAGLPYKVRHYQIGSDVS